MLRAADGGQAIVRTKISRSRRYAKDKQPAGDLLTRARKQNIPVTMFLVNGFQLRGTITGFDCFVVILDSEGRQQVIYKHAISTIAPLRPVELREDGTEDAV